MNSYELIQKAVKTVSDAINSNQELFLAQIIKMNPDIDLLKYQICYAPTFGEDIDTYGNVTKTYGQKWWLEEIE